MLNREQVNTAKEKALVYFQKAGITLTKNEEDKIEVADFSRS